MSRAGTTLVPSCADCPEIWEPPGTLIACPGLLNGWRFIFVVAFSYICKFQWGTQRLIFTLFCEDGVLYRVFKLFFEVRNLQKEASKQLKISTQIYLSLLTPLTINDRNIPDLNTEKYEHMFIIYNFYFASVKFI